MYIHIVKKSSGQLPVSPASMCALVVEILTRSSERRRNERRIEGGEVGREGEGKGEGDKRSIETETEGQYKATPKTECPTGGHNTHTQPVAPRTAATEELPSRHGHWPLASHQLAGDSTKSPDCPVHNTLSTAFP